MKANTLILMETDAELLEQERNIQRSTNNQSSNYILLEKRKDEIKKEQANIQSRISDHYALKGRLEAENTAYQVMLEKRRVIIQDLSSK